SGDRASRRSSNRSPGSPRRSCRKRSCAAAAGGPDGAYEGPTRGFRCTDGPSRGRVRKLFFYEPSIGSASVEFVAGRISPQVARRTSRWERRIDRAMDVESLVNLVCDFVESYAPEHFARLPEDCRPGPIKYEDDIDYWAYRLGQRYCAENDEPVDGSLLHDLLDYFLHALIRLAQLRRNLPRAARIKAQ